MIRVGKAGFADIARALDEKMRGDERKRCASLANGLIGKLPSCVLDGYFDAKIKDKARLSFRNSVIRRCMDRYAGELTQGLPSIGETDLAIKLLRKTDPLFATVFILNILEAFTQRESQGELKDIYVARSVSRIVREVCMHHGIAGELAFRIPAPTMERLDQISDHLPHHTRQEFRGMFFSL